jgi:RNA polymerase sigma factor (TIGR02999 family)
MALEVPMADNTQPTIPRLLEAVSAGERAALDDVVALLYDELRTLARRQRRRWRGDHTLDTTALVHETYLKLVRQERIATASRAHFLALASRAMRHILSNYAAERRAQKRGGGREPISLRELALAVSEDVSGEAAAEVLTAMHGALYRLEAAHARSCRVVECRFYGGLTIEETAAALGTSPRTVKRDWAYAQAWLNRELREIVPA